MNYRKAETRKSHTARLVRLTVTAVLLLPVLTVCAFAEETGGAVEVVNNLTNYVATIFKSIGVLACLFAGAQFATSLQSHDPSQRTSIMIFLGGLFFYFMPEILALIGVQV